MFHLRCAAAVFAAALIAAPAAHAAALDGHPASSGRLLLDPAGAPAGSALVAWTSDPQTGGNDPAVPKVCVYTAGACAPVTLTLPDTGNGVEGLFPVAGPGSTVWVFGPRESQGDVLRWTSTDGGKTFGAPDSITGADANGLVAPDDAQVFGPSVLLGATGSGVLGAGAFGPTGTAGAATHPADPGDSVQSSSLGRDAQGHPVLAYFNLGAAPEAGDSTVRFYRYTSADQSPAALATPANWAGPQAISTGYEPQLASGAAGLFAVTQDTKPGASRPTELDVRRDSGTGFGAPIATLSSAPGDLFAAGAATESPAGHLVIAWPQTDDSGLHGTMKLFTSTDGGATFATADVASIADGYLPDRNAQLAVHDDGSGYVTFRDGEGLIAGLPTPGSATQPPPGGTPTPTPTPTPVTVFNPARGPFLHTTVHVGGDAVTLATPKGCVRSGRILARMSIHSRRGRHGARIRVARFRYDGKLVSTLRRAPFTARFRVTLAPGSTHTISARATLHSHRGTHVTRTLRERFTACA